MFRYYIFLKKGIERVVVGYETDEKISEGYTACKLKKVKDKYGYKDWRITNYVCNFNNDDDRYEKRFYLDFAKEDKEEEKE